MKRRNKKLETLRVEYADAIKRLSEIIPTDDRRAEWEAAKRERDNIASELYAEEGRELKRAAARDAYRARSEVLGSLGLKRVRGNLGGSYYE